MIRFAVADSASKPSSNYPLVNRVSRRSGVFSDRRDRYNPAYARPLPPLALSLLAQGPHRPQREEPRFHAEDRESLGKTPGIPRPQPGGRSAGADRAGRDRAL